MNDLLTMDMKPSVAKDFKRVHSVITRGLQITIEKTGDVIQRKSLDSCTFNGFLDYLRSLTSFLHAHHLTEDELAFPMFQKKSLEAPYDLLMKDHVKMIKILNGLNPVIQKLAANNQGSSSAKKIHKLLRKLQDIWGPHIQKEESHFTENDIGTRFSADEQKQMSMQFAEHAMKNSGPDYLVVPFILYNLSGEDRKIISQLMPPALTQELIPITWKDKWAPMKPFLLD